MDAAASSVDDGGAEGANDDSLGWTTGATAADAIALDVVDVPGSVSEREAARHPTKNTSAKIFTRPNVSWLMRVAYALLALSQTGCSLFFNGNAGYAHAFAQAPERSAATANVYVGGGMGLGDRHAGVALGDALGLRTKWSDAVQHVSISDSIYFAIPFGSTDDIQLFGAPPAAVYTQVGLSLFTFESIAGATAASIGSPFVELGGFFRVFGQWGITATVSLEDDIRFNGIPDTGYVGFALGFGTLKYTVIPL
jgi:hypothetical protein